MVRARLIILLLCMPLFGFTCAYSVRDISVAPSYVVIDRGQPGLDLLVKDFESVVATLKEWAGDTEFKEGYCPPRSSESDFGSRSPGVFYLCDGTAIIEAVVYPEYNSTRVTFYDPRSFELIDRIVPEVKNYLKVKLGEGAVVEHQNKP